MGHQNEMRLPSPDGNGEVVNGVIEPALVTNRTKTVQTQVRVLMIEDVETDAELALREGETVAALIKASSIHLVPR